VRATATELSGLSCQVSDDLCAVSFYFHFKIYVDVCVEMCNMQTGLEKLVILRTSLDFLSTEYVYFLYTVNYF